MTNLGNAINFGAGVFLTAAHLFEGYEKGGEFKADSQDISVTQDQTIDGIAVPAPTYLYPYTPSQLGSTTAPGNDLALLKTDVMTDNGELTPVVVFADSLKAAKFLNNRPTSLATVTADNGSSGVSSAGGLPHQFTASITTADGDSGGAAVTTVGKQSYVDGILSGSAAGGSPSTFTYLDLTAYNTACANLPKQSNFSTMPPDLILGSQPGEHIRGSQRKADIICRDDCRLRQHRDVLRGVGPVGVGRQRHLRVRRAPGDVLDRRL